MATQHRQRPDRQRGFVGFVVGDVAYAVPIGNVREIVNSSPLTELPHAPHSVAGVLDHRGEVVPIVDLRARFGLSPSAASRRTKWILDRGRRPERRAHGGSRDGRFRRLRRVRPPPVLGPGDEARGVGGVAPLSGDLVFVLDVGRFDVLTQSLRPGALLGARGHLEGEP